jgi:carbon-monoxide dehydrogenase large subunit
MRVNIMETTFKYIGSRVKRKEDLRFITGRGTYIDDLKFPSMLYMAFLRSNVAHAKIKSIDTSKASRISGVVAIFTGKDLKDDIAPIPTSWIVPGSDLKVPKYLPMAVDRVRYVGEILAAVVAEDPYTAYDAIDAIEVDLEPLPAVTNVEDAIKPGAPQIHEEAPDNIAFRWRLRGGEDVEEIFKQADKIVSQRMINQRVAPSPMETRGAVASYNRVTRDLTLWVTSQNPHVHRLVLSGILGIPEHKIRVIAPDIGGGFGSKIHIYPGEVIVSWASMKLGRPIKWIETRREHFMATIHARDYVYYVDAAFKYDGSFLGLKARVFSNMGAYLSTLAPGLPTIIFSTLVPSVYKIRALDLEVYGVFTNTTPIDAYRGAGMPEAIYMVERILDIAARELRIDPEEIRRRNMFERAPLTTITGLTYDSGEYIKTFEKALEISGYYRLREEQKKALEQGRLVGVGISCYVSTAGFAPSRVARATGFGLGLWESALIRVHPTGKVTVYTGTHTHGQGGETVIAQIVADTLGVPIEDVEVIHGDTSITSFGLGTSGDRTVPVGGGAAYIASKKIIEKAKKIASSLLEAREEDVEFKDGRFYVKGAPSKYVDIKDVALAAYTADKLPKGIEPGLEAIAFYDPENFTFPHGVHICMVEIDQETGITKILKYIAIDDAGRIINPMLAEGQIHGGVLQGIGQALYEQVTYGEDGSLLTQTFSDYMIPTSSEAPTIESLFIETPSPHNPIGAKGLGETGTIAAPPAVVNAILDALSHIGIKHIDMPITPEKIYNAIKTKKPS